MLANVKIEQDKENKHIHRVFVDGKQIERITHLDFQVNPNEIPSVRLNIEQISGVDFEGQADVNFLNTPFTTQYACKVLRGEILKYDDIRNGFLESIKSAINEEMGPCEISNRLADKILKRMIGEE